MLPDLTQIERVGRQCHMSIGDSVMVWGALIAAFRRTISGRQCTCLELLQESTLLNLGTSAAHEHYLTYLGCLTAGCSEEHLLIYGVNYLQTLIESMPRRHLCLLVGVLRGIRQVALQSIRKACN
ncbi:hypothetical protein TNCV_228051 [Trichonephila clavipes]|nr:hypothetical protein TNCV_228051 [Trichonephila clavipes]